MKNFYYTFEFNEVVDKILVFANSERGKESVLNLEIIKDKQILKNELNVLKECISYVYRYGSFTISSSQNLEHTISLAIKGGILTPKDFQMIANDILISSNIFSNFNKHAHDYPNINNIISKFIDLNPLRTKIKNIINDNLEVDDKASEKLYSIRRNLKKLNEQLLSISSHIISKYANDLTDTTFTIRNGHYVLPFKTSLKNNIDGVIHDVSDSGVTTFIEPSELIKINNDIYLQKSQEREEIFRILKELTIHTTLYSDDIINNNKIIGYIDFINAKALYAKENDCVIANLNDKNNIINLINARHPLIDKKKIVPNSFYLDDNHPIILISGPNAGGKTVVLKTIGLLAIMNQCGLAIPCSEGSELSYFNHIYVDIGDNQSLSENLSTFASHISTVSFITNRVKTGDLVLLDELGTGTSPKEGEAIALATLKYLFKKKVFALITSHFDNVKAFALSHKNIENASMEFDEFNYEPTYKFKMGVPGKSYGLLMAKKYHLNNEILETSKKHISKQDNVDIEDSISKLNSEINRYNNLSKDLENKINDIKKREAALKIKEEKLLKAQENMTENINELIEKEVAKARDEIDIILKDIRKNNTKEHQIISAKTRLNNLELINDEVTLNNNEDQDFKVNDYALIPELNVKGKITAINGNKVRLYSESGVYYNVKINNLIKIDKIESKPFSRKTNKIDIVTKSMPLELNVIGFRGDEALIAVGNYLDDARLRNIKSVRIIHGSGQGILRKLIHEYLAKCDFVKEYHLGGQFDGQGGATNVVLK